MSGAAPFNEIVPVAVNTFSVSVVGLIVTGITAFVPIALSDESLT